MTTNLTTLRRSAAEILAAAAVEQFPGTSLVGGSGSHLGFQYDFIFPFPFQKEFLPLLEEKMRSIVKEERAVEIREMVPKNASLFFEHHKQPYIAEKAGNSKDSLVTIFQMGEFFDLVSTPFLSHSGAIVAFKLLDIEFLPQGITRIRGIAFSDKSRLKEHLKKRNHYAAVDHVLLGKQMHLFSEIQKGIWQWHPKGEFVRQRFLDLWKKEHLIQNFQFPVTPPLLTQEELLKAHLPFAPRVAEVNYFKRSCPSDELQGMFSTRGGTQDIAHIFCGAGNLISESISSLQFITKISKILSFERQWVLCVGRRRKHPSWKRACEALEHALKHCHLEYEQDEEVDTSRGPRLELRLQDGLGRFWPASYLEIDCAQMCLVRSMFGPLERMVALVLEQEGGQLPLWLAPEQARVFVVSRCAEEYARECVHNLTSLGMRVGIDHDSEQKLGARVHSALIEKVPYSIFVGEREKKSRLVTVRAYGSMRDEQMSLENLAQKLGMND